MCCWCWVGVGLVWVCRVVVYSDSESRGLRWVEVDCFRIDSNRKIPLTSATTGTGPPTGDSRKWHLEVKNLMQSEESTGSQWEIGEHIAMEINSWILCETSIAKGSPGIEKGMWVTEKLLYEVHCVLAKFLHTQKRLSNFPCYRKSNWNEGSRLNSTHVVFL